MAASAASGIGAVISAGALTMIGASAACAESEESAAKDAARHAPDSAPEHVDIAMYRYLYLNPERAGWSQALNIGSAEERRRGGRRWWSGEASGRERHRRAGEDMGECNNATGK